MLMIMVIALLGVLEHLFGWEVASFTSLMVYSVLCNKMGKKYKEWDELVIKMTTAYVVVATLLHFN